MVNFDDVLRCFSYEPGLDLWEAELFVPFWGEAVPVRIAAPAAGPSRHQADILGEILNYQDDLRSRVEGGLFAYYKQKVEGTTGYFERGVDVTAQRAPRLERS